jgi:hypothetical protein
VNCDRCYLNEELSEYPERVDIIMKTVGTVKIYFLTKEEGGQSILDLCQ